jgi:hypothetical protein
MTLLNLVAEERCGCGTVRLALVEGGGSNDVSLGVEKWREGLSEVGLMR